LLTSQPEELKADREAMRTIQKRQDIKKAFAKYDQNLKSNFLCVAKQEGQKNLPQNLMTQEGFIKSSIKAGLIP
jgi:hypothetical protein